MQAWKKSSVFFWEETPFFRLILPLILSITCIELKWLPIVSENRLIWSLIISFLLLLISTFTKKRYTSIRVFQFINTQLFIILLGWLVCIKTSSSNNPIWFGKFKENSVIFVGTILDKPLLREKTYKLKLQVNKAFVNNKLFATKGLAFVYIYRDSGQLNLYQGDEVIVPNNWTEIKNTGNPFEFDFARFCRWNGIELQQFLSRKEINVLKTAPKHIEIIQATHDWAMSALEKYVKDSTTLGLMQAMLIGDEVNFETGLRQSYSETGIIHIVAISGSHVMVFFAFISALLFWIRNKRFEAVKYLIAVPFVCFYVAVAGAPISAVRAAVMFSFLAFGMIVQKNKQPLNQLFATGFFMLLYEPMWLFSVGFQLSFIAVLSLIIFYKSICNLWSHPNKLYRALWQSIAASLAAEILVAPLVIYYYHLLPTMFLIANLFAYLFMGVVLILGLILVLVSKIGFLAKILAVTITFFVVVFNELVQFFQSLNPDSMRHIFLSFSEVTMLYIVITFFAVFIIKKLGKSLLIGQVSLLALLILFIQDSWKIKHQQKLIVYNVSKTNYAELILGNQYFPLFKDSSFNVDKSYATKEAHVVFQSWKKGDEIFENIISLKENKILFLNCPLNLDTLPKIQIDYLILNYPVKKCNALEFKQAFNFKKLVIAGNQKRYLMDQWMDCCRDKKIPAHIVMLQGAFVLE